MAAAAVIGAVWTSVDAARTEREIAYNQAQQRCESDTDANCEELATAIRSALADERAANLAAQQLWLNLLGLIGLGATVIFAAFAWREAQRSADAAHLTLDDARNDATEQAKRFTEQLAVASRAADASMKQVGVIEDTAKKQLAAYVHAESLEMIWTEGSDGHPLFTATLKNTGQTPAINVRAGGHYLIGNTAKLAAADDVNSYVALGRVGVIGANSPHETALIVESQHSIRAAHISKDAMLGILGRITYSDVFGRNYVTEFGFFTTNANSKSLATLVGKFAMFREAK